MNEKYTAVIKEEDGWWVGWIEEVPGVNCQERTKDELLESLREVLIEALEFNRQEARDAAEGEFSEEPLALCRWAPCNEQQALDLAERRAAELDSGEVKGLDYRAEMQRIRDSLRR